MQINFKNRRIDLRINYKDDLKNIYERIKQN